MVETGTIVSGSFDSLESPVPIGSSDTFELLLETTLTFAVVVTFPSLALIVIVVFPT